MNRSCSDLFTSSDGTSARPTSFQTLVNPIRWPRQVEEAELSILQQQPSLPPLYAGVGYEGKNIEELLPPELLELILRHVDRLSWVSCEWVCRRWKAILDTLLWTKEEHSQRQLHTQPACQYICEVASRGWLSVLQWARANGCPWDEMTCASAAEGGHLDVLQWARANGCPWDVMTCANAAGGGHLEVLQWARTNGCPWNESTCAKAASGHEPMDVHGMR